jgi:hypothetical protein
VRRTGGPVPGYAAKGGPGAEPPRSRPLVHLKLVAHSGVPCRDAAGRLCLHVLASRARERTTLYVTVHDLLPPDDDERVNQVTWDPASYTAREILEQVLAAEDSELPATQVIHASQEQAGSLATLVPRYLHAARLQAARRYADAAIVVFGGRDGQLLTADPAWGALVRRLYDAEAAGWQPERLLADAARQRELGTADSTAEVLCWRIDRYIQRRVPPAHLRQPMTSDAERYARLLAAHPKLSTMTFDAGQALTVPPALTVTGEEHARDSSPPDYRGIVAAAIGSPLTGRAQAEAAWPAVGAALRRAHHAGHDPAAVLTIVARGRELRTTRAISQTLAWRIGRYLTSYPDPVTSTNDTADPGTWRTLAWTLKAAETAGTPAETIISAARQAVRLTDLIAAAHRAARQHAASPDEPELPWLRRLRQPPGSAADAELESYLSEAATLISARVRYLAGQAERDRPAWMSLLGQPPASVHQREQWQYHVGVIAAYRDQHQITAGDPHQILGPYPEPGHAGHAAYWHTVQSVNAARHLARIEPVTDACPDPVTSQIAADIYRSLPAEERERIRVAITERLRPLPFGVIQPDDDVITQPACARYLVQALTEHGQLIPTRRRPSTARPAEADLTQRATGTAAEAFADAQRSGTQPRTAHDPLTQPATPYPDAQPHQQRVTATP